MTVSFEELEDVLAATEDTNEGELTDLLNSFLEALPDTERRLFVGRYWYAYPVNRMAEAYGMTPNAVSKQLARTRERLKAYLEGRGYSV
jgi:RNA polymerase sigma-70 factor (ECF subfamily)